MHTQSHMFSVAHIYPCSGLDASGPRVGVSPFCIKCFFRKVYSVPQNATPPCPHRGGLLGLSVSPPSAPPLALTAVLQPLTPQAVVHHISTFRNQPVDPTVPPAQALCWELPGTCPPQLGLLHGPHPKPCDLRSFSLVTKPCQPPSQTLAKFPLNREMHTLPGSAMLQATSQTSASSWGLKPLYVCAQTGASVGKDPGGGWGQEALPTATTYSSLDQQSQHRIAPASLPPHPSPIYLPAAHPLDLSKDPGGEGSVLPPNK